MKFLSIKEQINIIKQGTEEILPENELISKLERSYKSGEPLIVKLGCDPSTPDLHLGHGVVLRKMRHFQDLGHQVVLVIGDFTGMIGDPSGRNKTRPQLTIEEVKVNAQTYIEQAKVILDVNKLKVVYNSTWLDVMRFSDVVKLASKYTIARMLERDDFTKRFKAEIPISIHEFLYPLAQGMDSVELKADIELGGTDQKFNLLVGRDLQRESGQEPQVILTVPLLEGTDGVEKMSKSYGNHIALRDTPEDMYGKTLSIPDEMIEKYFLLAADAESTKLDEVKRKLADGVNPRDLKRELARMLVEKYYDKNSAVEAENRFDQIHLKKDVPDDIPEYELKSEKLLVDVLTDANLTESKGEARRLIKQNAVRINKTTINDINHMLKPETDAIEIKVGKRRFLKIING
ncbi:MAG: tyrosine--tRNA ligase [Candidatus Neomarinimicrobiota bacterium]